MMGAFFSSITRYRHLLSSNSFNNTTALPINQQPISVLASAEHATPVDIIIVPGSITTSGSATPAGDNREQDNSEGIAEQVQQISIAVAAGSFTLLANPPNYVDNILVLYKIYMLFHLLSIVLSIFSLLFFIRKTTPNLGVSWIQHQAMKMAIVSIAISVTLRIFLLLSPIVWYDVLIPLLLVGGISLYLWYGYIKANYSSRQTSSPALTSSYTNEV